MARILSREELAQRVAQAVQGVVEDWNTRDVWVRPDALFDVCKFLKEDSDFHLDYLVSISAVDYIHYFEVVYHLASITFNHSLVLKTRCQGREAPTLPSVTALWRGAELQEREIYDLMGITFSEHPNLKRIMLWEGFPGHPLRKDYLESPR